MPGWCYDFSEPTDEWAQQPATTFIMKQSKPLVPIGTCIGLVFFSCIAYTGYGAFVKINHFLTMQGELEPAFVQPAEQVIVRKQP